MLVVVLQVVLVDQLVLIGMHLNLELLQLKHLFVQQILLVVQLILLVLLKLLLLQLRMHSPRLRLPLRLGWRQARVIPPRLCWCQPRVLHLPKRQARVRLSRSWSLPWRWSAGGN